MQVDVPVVTKHLPVILIAHTYARIKMNVPALVSGNLAVLRPGRIPRLRLPLACEQNSLIIILIANSKICQRTVQGYVALLLFLFFVPFIPRSVVAVL